MLLKLLIAVAKYTVITVYQVNFLVNFSQDSERDPQGINFDEMLWNSMFYTVFLNAVELFYSSRVPKHCAQIWKSIN